MLEPTDLTMRAIEALRTTFGAEATVVGRAPGRVNLIGEHTDYNAGLVLPVALPHATYAAAAPRTDGVVRIASGQEPEPFTGHIDELGPEIGGWAAYVAGVLWTLRFASARYDAGTGMELLVVTIVLLGGVSIFGGRGTIAGVVIAVY